jgi:amidohydrolase
LLASIFKSLEERFDEMVAIRRDFHMNPELSFKEVRTPKKVAEFYQQLGLDFRTEVGGRGVVATLKGGKPGKTVALRADFDALPIQDEKDVPYKSKVDGVMHACGHDAHTAQLLVLAKVLTEFKAEISGTIVFIHQFAEEAPPGGAKPMIEDGCLDGVDIIFGSHLWSNFPVGQVGYRQGYTMAAMDRFTVKIKGKGGHGAAPHETIDSIVLAGQLLSKLQTIVSRRVNPIDPAVVTVGDFHGGKAFNVIAEETKLSGTVRCFKEDVRILIEDEIEKAATSVCEGSGATAEVVYERGYPALWNHVDETMLVAECGEHVVGEENTFIMEPIMAGEDFAYYLQHVPGAFFFTGARNDKIDANYPHHHARFDIDEKSMLIASKMLASAALRFLNGGGQVENSSDSQSAASN